ncbi:PP2C family protein-serine/threonine phosphatase [Catenulispora subtropica]|uniref:PP2C family protein-serine/threonine phosphatase n=1 Tax=Catenulispora subtropica TaxID=450798 RepID=A0ABN2T5N4_9ACTN
MSVAKHGPQPVRRPGEAGEPAASDAPGVRPDAAELAGLLDLVDQAVVVCDQAGKLRWCNAPAWRLLPGLRLGEAPTGPLGRAAARGDKLFEAEVEGRELSGRRVERDSLWGVGGHAWLVRDESGDRERLLSQAAQGTRSEFLAEAGRTLCASLHPGRTVRAVVKTAVPALADTAAVFLPIDGTWSAWHRAGPDQASGRFTVAEAEEAPLVARALRGLLTRPERCGRRDLTGLADALAPWRDDDGEALVVTLPGVGAPSGVLVLARGSGRPAFDAADTDLAEEFAARAGMALAAAALYTEQADAASAMHEELVPDALPRIPGVHLAAAYRPAHEGLQLSGDFYHVRPSAVGGGADFVFGDVCGSGVEAAVIGGRVRRSLRTLAAVESQPVPVLHRLNELLLEDSTATFATMVFGSARPAENGGLDVLVAGGGHLPPLVLRTNGRVEDVDIGGTLVGALPEAEFEQATVHLAPGELMLLYSDGITEARGGPTEQEMYGEHRLIRDLATCAGMPAGAVAERVDLLLGQWLAGRPHDDLAVLVIQAPPAQPAATPALRSERAEPVDGRPR